MYNVSVWNERYMIDVTKENMGKWRQDVHWGSDAFKNGKNTHKSRRYYSPYYAYYILIFSQYCHWFGAAGHTIGT